MMERNRSCDKGNFVGQQSIPHSKPQDIDCVFHAKWARKNQPNQISIAFPRFIESSLVLIFLLIIFDRSIHISRMASSYVVLGQSYWQLIAEDWSKFFVLLSSGCDSSLTPPSTFFQALPNNDKSMVDQCPPILI